MTHSHIDHLVITVPNLETGSQWIEQQLGVPMQPGGEHPLMGTHNLLLSLGPECYLEVIANSPTLPAPDHPRWFNMDNLTANSNPSLATWVARTTDIEQTAAQASENLGPINTMYRGDLDWHITIPSNGGLPLDGTAPALIQWKTTQLPAANLFDQGVRLEHLELCHPKHKQLTQLINSLAMLDPIQITPAPHPHLKAYLKVAGDIRCITSASA